jgi:hypothetical protein
VKINFNLNIILVGFPKFGRFFIVEIQKFCLNFR